MQIRDTVLISQEDYYWTEIRVSKFAMVATDRLFLLQTNRRVLPLCQIWIIKCLSDNLSKEKKNTGVSREMIIQK